MSKTLFPDLEQCQPGPTYRASVTSPAAGVRVTVNPPKLRFSATQKTRAYEITFEARGVGSVNQKYTSPSCSVLLIF